MPETAINWIRSQQVSLCIRRARLVWNGQARHKRQLPNAPIGRWVFLLAIALHILPVQPVLGQATWQPLGPTAVQTQSFGPVTGRVAAIAFDPSDPTGNRVYVGATGGGVWAASNAGASDLSSIVFTPLTDSVNALNGAIDASITIGALTVQPGGTGVILAGTGDPNDALDSYYGTGILRSADSGTTWTLIQKTRDAEDGLGGQDFSFVGEGFAGFAWSTANPQIVVAAVAQAAESALVAAGRPNLSYAGLYYSADSGATWHLATITDGSGKDVQGPIDAFAVPDGNAATAVVWNPARQLFVAAVRHHGYYQSADGITWTRMAAQPGAGLTTQLCPNNLGGAGSLSCPIFRGALAVNPASGDTFAWTVDGKNQDQGLWQDSCNLNGSACGNTSITFAKQWSTAALESRTADGSATILNGNYNLALAATPNGQDTVLLAGDSDVWRCSLTAGCAWRNTTNAIGCMSAQVGPFQHALAWNPANPLEIFIGNDSGLWRSIDGIGETGASCAAADATHFQNLNGSLGSLAEVVSLSPVMASPYVMMAGLGVNGTAGVKGTAATAEWPQILTGYGGPVTIDPANDASWYVNNQAGVSIYLCAQASLCAPADFGSGPVVTNSDVNLSPGATATPAPFLVDPLDPTQLLIATCQLWRGPANGVGWSAANAITPILDSGVTNTVCNGDALVHSISAMALPSGSELIYLGMYGAADGGAHLPGHVWSIVFNPSSSTAPVVTDLTMNPVVNDVHTLNVYGLDISSVFVDPSDTTGKTVYVTVAGVNSPAEGVQVVYRSTDGGAHWSDLMANLPAAPANSISVDPRDPNIVYLATDQGVYFTTQVASCAVPPHVCWSRLGSGLPSAPVVALEAAAATASPQVLVAGTYGRGIWQAPLLSAGAGLTTATASPTSLEFGNQTEGSASAARTVTIQNTGSAALTPTSVSVSAGYSEIDGCVNASIAPGGSCAIQVVFAPTIIGKQTGQLIVYANLAGGQMVVGLDGTGTASGAVTLTSAIVSLGSTAVGSTSAPLPIAVANNGASAIPINGLTVTGPFALASNACGTVSLAPNSDCQIEVSFAPTQSGPATGLLTLNDGAGTQTVELTGTGLSAPTDTLSTASLTFQPTATGQSSAPQVITLTNSGGQPLASITLAASAGFQVTNSCGTQLAANSSCTVAVQFAPTQLGSITGTLTVSDALRTQTVSLSGTGVAPAILTVNPASLTFANQQPGVPSAPQTVTVTNGGGASLANIGFEIIGPAAASYAISANTCGAILNSGSSCTVQVVFTPAATGPIAATLVVSSSTPGVKAVAVPLNGSGLLGGGLSLLPALLTFPAVGVNQSSSAQPVLITNSTAYSIASMTISVTGPFSIVQNTCTGSLAVGASCGVGVVFTPTATGTVSGALTVASPALAVPVTAVLAGTGFDFSIAISGAGSLTVASGQTANFPLLITSSGAQATFSFNCGTIPKNAACIFNPPSESLNLGVQGNVTAEILTGQSSPSALVHTLAGLRSLPFFCALLFLARARRNQLLLLAVLMAFCAAFATSCTSSSGGTGGNPTGGGSGSSTPPGTYTIPVTITSTGISHSVNLTLVVD
ncbi:MAG TPA: choice-of-anchor D domain-containing protein [Terracidiphilus sp.]|nr:choice-of-anchor D domain-containing protein [Terracidiphilus sp.]